MNVKLQEPGIHTFVVQEVQGDWGVRAWKIFWMDGRKFWSGWTLKAGALFAFYEVRHKKKAARWRCDVTFFKVVRGGKTSDNPVQVQKLGGGAVITVSPCE